MTSAQLYLKPLLRLRRLEGKLRMRTKTKLLCSSATLDGLLKMVREYYMNDRIRFEPDQDDEKRWQVWISSNGINPDRHIHDTFVVQRGNRFRLETTVLNAVM